MSKVEKLKDLIISSLEEKKSDNISIIPLDKSLGIAEYMIFASGKSTKNIAAIAEFIAYKLKHEEDIIVRVEGQKNSDWILVDAYDIIVHIFHPQTREALKLEEHWQRKK